ncbi:MAG: hypothetical protein EWV75_05920 [Microcystis wesenbergii Mw_QC_S_20081001_S30D]|jgi:pyruvate-formate lyase|uniref:Uncharacterized protein n=1 Tax=Microcystis wesenbergii Mw_QC_S_20081001_S30D TaxID=2486245 RepID=A0A552JSZ1_9CHRO|nr:hypothetical protein [Microcystis aeruginosa W11-03]NCR94871.1 hypothetical protein [Microcystis aeruginosa W11-06]TRU98858.1 MAG: hypothetical protein EWV75_05920 [Microcystis wesenbergii Mw_QC_S_20081001_S30D]TRV01091.1 MAG: hypothetical protein EWV74_11305 [Microcystis wesenbergii Mw_QC_S_20081001_S30]TRV04487.1 MAG: hypothetical protein EWV73_02750 [Microcystis wesenbergii Mw_QC_B_20070930_S4D]TRV11081.1 MAG: hypothetical protein EWV89_15790 [Microcystis wesenbergii Mw_QC_B_20070930_S4]
MAISITLTLPDEIFNLAQSLAHSINRDLNDILVEAIAFSISLNYQGEKISSLNSLSDEEIIKLTQLQMASEQDQRLSELLNQQQERDLSTLENRELWSLMQIYQINLLKKAQGLNEAVKRGLISPLEA